MIRVRLHFYDYPNQRGLYSFRGAGKIVILRWIRGPLSRVNRLLRTAAKS